MAAGAFDFVFLSYVIVFINQLPVCIFVNANIENILGRNVKLILATITSRVEPKFSLSRKKKNKTGSLNQKHVGEGEGVK